MSAAPAPQHLMLSLERVSLGYRGKPVLHDLDLEVPAGDFLGIVGPNGSGKTTLLRGILGAIPPLAGRLIRRTPSVAYVPQVDTVDLFFPLTALEVVRMGTFGRLGRLRPPGRAESDRARQCLGQVGLGGMEQRLFRSMSGGQRQRTLLARALAAGSDLLLLDEPTSGMDLAAEKAVMDLITALHRDGGRTVMLVTHQLNLVANYARRIAILQRGSLSAGPVSEILSAEHLSALYGLRVRVEESGGRRIVVV